MVDKTIAQRFVEAYGGRDAEALDRLYADDVVLYSPVAWPVRGKDALKAFVDGFHTAFPRLRVALHDEFYSADGTRGCFRFVLHWHHTGAFFGYPPTGRRGTMTETHSIRISDDLIVEQFVGDNTFQMPHLDLVVLGIEFPQETPDPSPETISAQAPPGAAATAS